MFMQHTIYRISKKKSKIFLERSAECHSPGSRHGTGRFPSGQLQERIVSFGKVSAYIGRGGLVIANVSVH